MFQSTRPHGARRAAGRPAVRELPVSIHAPAWGATLLSILSNCKHLVSIHAPAWGATSTRSGGILGYWFQSTRPHGARP